MAEKTSSIPRGLLLEFERIKSEIEDIEAVGGPTEYQIITYPSDFTLEVLHTKFKNGEIKLPEFQRKFMWSQKQASRLIDSFMLRLPVPEIFLYSHPDTEYDIVVDGHQRLQSVFSFFDNRWFDTRGRSAEFRLKGLPEDRRWGSKTFDEFSEAAQRKLKRCTLRSITIKQLQPKGAASIYEIFDRLNTGGTNLTPQEVRNCIYAGELNDLLIELNKDTPSWRKILGSALPHKRQRDVELVLRFFALLDKGDKYRKKPMKDFMAKYMEEHRNPPAQFKEHHKTIFQRTTNAILNSLGPKPFHLKRGLNVAVFDAVFVAFAKNIDSSMPKDLIKRYKKLLKDENFEKWISASTTDVKVVESRLALARKVLFGKKKN